MIHRSRTPVLGPGRSRLATAGLLAVSVVVVAGLTACGQDGSKASDTTAPRAKASTSTTAAAGSALAGTAWKLRDAVADTSPTLDFAAAGKVSGSTGCNRIAGTYEEDGSSLRVELGPMTQMACASDAANQQEQQVVDALGNTRSARRTDVSLTLLDGSGKELLSYTAVSGELAGTSWAVLGVNTGDAVETSALTEKLTVEFSTDGKVSGSGGCNTFTGPYTQDGSTISFGELDSTTRSCADDVMHVEDSFFAALAASTAVERSGDSLTLRDDGGAMQVTASLAG